MPPGAAPAGRRRSATWRDAAAEEQQRLDGYGWVDRDARRRAHPDRAGDRRCGRRAGRAGRRQPAPQLAGAGAERRGRRAGRLPAPRAPTAAGRALAHDRASPVGAASARSRPVRCRGSRPAVAGRALARAEARAGDARPPSAADGRSSDVGFDQQLGAAAAARPAASATRPAARCASATTSASRPVVLALGLLPLPDALHAGARRRSREPRRRSTFDAGPRLRGRRRQLRPARDAGAGRGEEGRDARALRPARRPTAAGTSSPATRTSIARADRGGRLPLRLRRAEPSSSRTPRGIVVLTPRRPDRRATSTASSYAPRDLRLALVEASAGKIGDARRPAAALLLPLRPGDRQLHAPSMLNSLRARRRR